MKYGALLAVLAALALVAAGCGGGEKKAETDTEANPQATAACDGSALTATPKLPPSFPLVENTTLTKQSTDGPTNVVEGYWKGGLKEAHDEYVKEFKAAGYDVLFEEVDEHDSEVSWKGEGRTGQVALRDDCGEGKIYVHITNRPA
jgi:ABC-type glycerol-3-phosphate transport system substrate-binding protein